MKLLSASAFHVLVKDGVTSRSRSLPNRLTAAHAHLPRMWNVRRLSCAHISVCRSRHQKYDIYVRTFASSKLHTNVQAPDLTRVEI